MMTSLTDSMGVLRTMLTRVRNKVDSSSLYITMIIDVEAKSLSGGSRFAAIRQLKNVLLELQKSVSTRHFVIGSNLKQRL